MTNNNQQTPATVNDALEALIGDYMQFDNENDIPKEMYGYLVKWTYKFIKENRAALSETPEERHRRFNPPIFIDERKAEAEVLLDAVNSGVIAQGSMLYNSNDYKIIEKTERLQVDVVEGLGEDIYKALSHSFCYSLKCEVVWNGDGDPLAGFYGGYDKNGEYIAAEIEAERFIKYHQKAALERPQVDALEYIKDIELPAGEYKINGVMAKIGHTFKVETKQDYLSDQSAVIRDLQGYLKKIKIARHAHEARALAYYALESNTEAIKKARNDVKD